MFQMKQDITMEQWQGVITVHYNMVMFRVSNEDHDANLINLLKVYEKVLNSRKLEFSHNSVSFFGTEHNYEEMYLDPKNSNALSIW